MKGDNMLYITGDTHNCIDFQKLSYKNWPVSKKFSKEDYVIIAGDFGLPWDNSKTDLNLIKWYNERPYSILFVDGNHENFDLLKQFPKEEKFGGIVSKISKNIYWLHRGEIYNICGKDIFTFGGAYSVDKMYRKEGVSWWKDEVPTNDEFNYGLSNLEKYNNKVDIVITHDCPTSIAKKICNWYEEDSVKKYLEFVKNNINFNNWYFGHHHVDISLENGKFVALYNEISQIST